MADLYSITTIFGVGSVLGALFSLVIAEEFRFPVIRENVVIYCIEKPKLCETEYQHYKTRDNLNKTVKEFKAPVID
jgi:hypothetical protein